MDKEKLLVLFAEEREKNRKLLDALTEQLKNPTDNICEHCKHEIKCEREKCAVMETPPREFFCWANKEKMINNEIAILNYAIGHGSEYEALNAVKRVIKLRDEK